MNLRKRRDFGEVISDSIVFIRKNFKPFMLAVLAIAGPFLLISAIYSGINEVKFTNMLVTSSFLGFYSKIFGYSALIALFSNIMLSSVVLGYIKLYMSLKRAPSIEEVWRSVRSNFWKVLGVTLLSTISFCIIILLGVGPVVAISGILGIITIPAALVLLIYMVIKLSLAVPAAVLGDDVVFDSLGRSWDYTRGHFWATLGLWFVLIIISVLMGGVLQIPAAIVRFIVLFNGGYEGEGSLLYIISLVLNILSRLAASFTYVLAITGLGIYYLSLEEKNEGQGLLERIEQLDANEKKWGEEHY